MGSLGDISSQMDKEDDDNTAIGEGRRSG